MKMWFSILLVSLSVTPYALSANSNLCEILRSETNDKPCQCLQPGTLDPERDSNQPRSVTVGCNRGTMPQILRAIRLFPTDTRLEKLWLWDNVLPLVPRSFFSNVSTGSLVLETSEVGAFLPGSLQTLGPGLTELELRQNALDRIGPGMFANLVGLKRLSLNGNRLTSVGRSDFAGLVSLRHLSLQRNNLSQLAPAAFGDLASLTLLDLSNNQLQVLTEGVFVGLPRLESLSLSNNAIAEISDRAFEPLVNLKILDLSSNRLVALNGCGKLPALQKLFLSNNQISDLENVDISDSTLPALRILHLDKNKLVSLDQGSFGTTGTHLSTISITNNIISSVDPGAFRGLSALHTMSLQQNKIHELPESTFEPLRSLQRLFLSHNRIEVLEMDSLIGLDALRVLNLGHNKLSTVDVGAFLPLQSLEKLYLNDNNIAAVSNATLAHLPKTLGAIDISANPWRCACADIWMANWFASCTAPELGITQEPWVQLPRPTFLQPQRTFCMFGQPLTEGAMDFVDQHYQQQQQQNQNVHANDLKHETDETTDTHARTNRDAYVGSLVSDCTFAQTDEQTGTQHTDDVSVAPAVKSATSVSITSLAIILAALSVAIIFGIAVLFYRDQTTSSKQHHLSTIHQNRSNDNTTNTNNTNDNVIINNNNHTQHLLDSLGKFLHNNSSPNLQSILSRAAPEGTKRPLTQSPPKKSVTICLPHDMVQLLPQPSPSPSLDHF